MGTKFWGKGFLGKVLWGQNVGDKDFEITFVAQKRVEERFSSGEDWMQSKKKLKNSVVTNAMVRKTFSDVIHPSLCLHLKFSKFYATTHSNCQ